MGVNLRFLLMIALFSLSCSSISWALIEPSNLNSGETAIFNSTFSYCNHRILVEEPSKSYVENPDYLIILSTYCNSSARRRTSEGNITVPSDFPDGSAAVIFNGLNYPSESLIFERFNVNNHDSEWTYKLSISNSESNWNTSEFDDSSWIKGEMPFGTPVQFGNTIKTNWTSNRIYVRKTVNLSTNIQANLRITAENDAVCWVNGNRVLLINNNLVGINLGRCAGTYYARYYANGEWRDRSYNTGTYLYRGSHQIDISKYLHPGENIIACTASTDNNVFSNSYSGRPFLNVEFLPLRNNDIFWSTSNTEYTNKNYDVTYNFREYSCKKMGCSGGSDNCYTYGYRYDLNFVSQWQWSNLPISDSTLFYGHPERYSNEGGWDTARIIYAKLPYNGSTTYYRKWVWSDENIVKILKLTDTKQPTCYLNGNLLQLDDYNHEYWVYHAPIQLIPGPNLISCSSTSAQMNFFDMDTSGYNNGLNISGVSLENLEENLAKFKVTVSDLAHPETDTALIIEIWQDDELILEDYKKIDSAETWQEKEYIGLEEIHTKIIDNPSNIELDKLIAYSENATNSQRAFDGNWNTYSTKVRNTPKMFFDENYTFVPVDISNSISQELIFATWTIKATTNSAIIEFFDENGEQIEVFNNKICANNACNTPQSKTFDIIPFILNDSFNVKTTMTDGNYFEGKIDLGYLVVVEYWTLLERSNATETFEVELQPGIYNLVVTAADLITGEIDVYSAEIIIEADEDTFPIIQRVGFVPTSGSSSERSGENNVGSSFLIAAGAVAGVIATAGAYVYNKKSGTNLKVSLKQIENSISKTDNAIAKLNSIFHQSNQSNQATFFSIVHDKYVAFKDYITKLAAEEDEIEKYLEEEKARQKAFELAQAIKIQNRTAELLEKYKIAVSDAKDFMRSKVTEDFLGKYGHELSSDARQTLLQNEKYFASLPIQKEWSANASSIQGALIREQTGNQFTIDELYKMGFVTSAGTNYVFDNDKYNKFLSAPQQETFYPQQSNKENLSWWEKIRLGINYSINDMANGISNFFNSTTNTINSTSNLFMANPFGVISAGIGGIRNITNTELNKIVNAITNPINTILKIGNSLGNVVINSVNSYVETFKKDPIDVIAKTMITVAGVAGIIGGVVLAPITGGGSLLLTYAGIASLAGVGMIIGNELYSYATAQDDEELYQRATDDNWSDAIFIVSGTIQGVQMLKLGQAIRPDIIISKSSKEQIAKELVKRGTFENYDDAFNAIGGSETWPAATQKWKDLVFYLEDTTEMAKWGSKRAVEWHEATHIAGQIKQKFGPIPEWLNINSPKFSPILSEGYADAGAARFILKQELLNSPATGYYLRTFNLNQMRATHLPWWYNRPYLFSAPGIIADVAYSADSFNIQEGDSQ